MTSVTFETNVVAAGLEMLMHVCGHAEYRTDGPDIVCAAASMLTQALAAALVQMKPEKLPLIYTANEETAEACVWYLATDPLDYERAASMFAVARAGFELLEKNYPKNVLVAGESPVKH